MRIRDLIIGLMIFATLGLTLFSFTANFYSEDNLNVTFDENTQSKFDLLRANLATTNRETNEISESFQSYAPGGTNQTLTSDKLDAGDLAISAWKAVMQVPTILGIFANMISFIGSSLNINTTIIGFIIGSLIIGVVLTLIGISFYREVM